MSRLSESRKRRAVNLDRTLPRGQLSANPFHSSYKALSASPHLTGEDTEGHGVICLETDVRILNPSPTASKHPELTRQHLLPSPRPRSLCLLCGQEGNGTGPPEGKAVSPSRGNELGLSVIMEANNRWQYTHVTMWCLCSTSRFPFLGSVSFPKKHFL